MDQTTLMGFANKHHRTCKNGGTRALFIWQKVALGHIHHLSSLSPDSRVSTLVIVACFTVHTQSQECHEPTGTHASGCLFGSSSADYQSMNKYYLYIHIKNGLLQFIAVEFRNEWKNEKEKECDFYCTVKKSNNFREDGHLGSLMDWHQLVMMNI